MPSDKKPFALRINDRLFKDLEKWASDEFRSVNGQIEYLLSKAVNEKYHKKDKVNDPKES